MSLNNYSVPIICIILYQDMYIFIVIGFMTICLLMSCLLDMFDNNDLYKYDD